MSCEELKRGASSSRGLSTEGPVSPRSASSVTSRPTSSTASTLDSGRPSTAEEDGSGRPDTHCSASSCPAATGGTDSEDDDKQRCAPVADI